LKRATRIDGKAFTSDVEAGLDSAEVMRKFRISEEQFQELLELVSERGVVDDGDLARIRSAANELICDSCGHSNELGANFCSECGSILAEETSIETSGFKAFIRANEGFIKVGLAFLFLYSIRHSDPLARNFPDSRYWGCGIVAGYIAILTVIFISELHGLRRAIRDQVCNSFFREGFLFHIICQRRLLTTTASAFFAVLLSCSLTIFMFTTNVTNLGILALDTVIFLWLSSYVPGYLSRQVADSAHGILAQLFLIISNVMTLFFMFVVYWIFETYWLQPETIEPFVHPDTVASVVIAEVKHSCWPFRTVARFVYAAGLFIEGLQSIPIFGKWLYPLFYFTSLSLLPFVGVTVVYNCFLGRR
jgi:hypothetical protein